MATCRAAMGDSSLARGCHPAVSPRDVCRVFANGFSGLRRLSRMSPEPTPRAYSSYKIKYINYTSIEREEKVGDKPRRIAKSFTKFCHQRGAPTIAEPRENSVPWLVPLGEGPRGDA